MRLVHYDKQPIAFDWNCVYPRKEMDTFKPSGLWVSDAHDYGWKDWCTAEDFCTDSLEYEYLVELQPDHNILIISTVEELDKFHEEYSVDILKAYRGSATPFNLEPRKEWLDWNRIYPLYQGIIITPYLWERRMSGYMWYYGWDCAGGCIWDLSAIKTFQQILKQLIWKGGNNA